MAMTVKVSPKYQVVIPEQVRNALKIKAGSRVEVVAKGRIAYLVPVVSVKEMQSELAGKLGGHENVRDKKDRKL